MKTKIFVVGMLHTNCYVILKENKCLIIDPGDEENKIISYIKENNFTPVGIITTHSHPDHIKCAESISLVYNIKIYNFNNLFEGMQNIDPFLFEVIYTPGHTDDSISIYFKDENIMFTGDFIFKNAIGRTDLKGGSYSKMLDSLRKIKKYNDNIVIMPGHGEKTTLIDEKIED